MRKSCHDLKISREPLNQYGSLEKVIRDIRDHRPLDLNAEVWHAAHPKGTFEEWKTLARDCVLGGLHYDAGPLDLRAETLSREERDGFVLERVAFNTTPWFRVNGFLLLPTGVEYPVPGLVVFHAWGGPMLFGAGRIVNTGRDHPVLVAHREKVYSGNYLAEAFAKQGYGVIVISSYHFGERAPRGFADIPDAYDPFDTTVEEFEAIEAKVRSQLYIGVRQLNWAGTTWMGVFFGDDSRCIDYLLTRPEVDGDRIGCTGVSVGGWRTNMLAALDDRIKASVSVGWMTTCDYQQVYNVTGGVGTFCLLPGVWNRLDVPDLTIMSAPKACMVVSGTEDRLFAPEGQAEAARQIALGYDWAGCPDRFGDNRPDKVHCYDADIQRDAFAWFERFL